MTSGFPSYFKCLFSQRQESSETRPLRSLLSRGFGQLSAQFMSGNSCSDMKEPTAPKDDEPHGCVQSFQGTRLGLACPQRKTLYSSRVNMSRGQGSVDREESS